jgi:hypothetical protein
MGQEPKVNPELGLGDVLGMLPIIEEVISLVEGAIAGHQAKIPTIKVRVKGHHVELGPTPVKVLD